MKNKPDRDRAEDPYVKYRRDWNRADKAIACRHLSKADRLVNERVRDEADDSLFTGTPTSLPGAGDLVNHGAQALTGTITDELRCELFSIGKRLKQGALALADVVALRRAIAACGSDAMEAGELDVMEAGYKADILAMLRPRARVHDAAAVGLAARRRARLGLSFGMPCGGESCERLPPHPSHPPATLALDSVSPQSEVLNSPITSGTLPKGPRAAHAWRRLGLALPA